MREVYKHWSIAFVEPRYSINIGYVARVMANFGLKELFLVYSSRKLGYRKLQSQTAIKYASHGRFVLSKARVVRTLLDLRSEKTILIATTAITAKRTNTKRRWMPPDKIPGLLGAREDVAIVLGRDTTGLTKKELEECDLVIHIPTWSEYPTLNVSHALAVTLYSIAREYNRGRYGEENIEPPSPQEIQALNKIVREAASKAGYDAARTRTISLVFRRLISSSHASRREVRAIMGLIRRLSLGLNNSAFASKQQR